jgi:hypothetical protein
MTMRFVAAPDASRGHGEPRELLGGGGHHFGDAARHRGLREDAA